MSWLVKSSIGRKVVMSVTGLALILFLTFHMSMNLVALFSGEAYNMICEFLGANWYALVATVGLAALFIAHIVYAFILFYQNKKARGNDPYAVPNRPRGIEWASQNMLALGVVVLGGLFLHMYHFWAKMQLVEIMGHHSSTLADGTVISPTDGASLIQYTFNSPVNLVLYLVWLCAIWFHLTHGFWSALQTIGWNNTLWQKRLEKASNIYSTVIVLGFAVVIVYYYLASLGVVPMP